MKFNLGEEKMLIGSAILLIFLFFLIFVVKSDGKKKLTNNSLTCPIRGSLWAKKYNGNGKYSEEYQRIKLIKYLLKKGYSKENFIIEYAIPIGHKGNNSLRVDLVLKKGDYYFLVAEVKKSYTKKTKRSAIKHQLIPAMRLLNSKHGIYFDGTVKSRILTKNSDGTISIRSLS